MFSAIWRRFTLVVSLLDKASDIVERSFADSIPGCGNTSLKTGSSGTLDLNCESFNCVLKFGFTDRGSNEINNSMKNRWIVDELTSQSNFQEHNYSLA